MKHLKLLGTIALVLGVVLSVVVSLNKKSDTYVISNPIGGTTNFDTLVVDQITANATTSIGGVLVSSRQQSFTAATSTLCALENPFQPATSTLDYYLGRVTTGFGTNTAIYVGTTTQILAQGSTTSVPVGQGGLIYAVEVATGSLAWINNDPANLGNGAGNYFFATTVFGFEPTQRATSTQPIKRSITVGPDEWVVVYATGTVPGGATGANSKWNAIGSPHAGTCDFRFIAR